MEEKKVALKTATEFISKMGYPKQTQVRSQTLRTPRPCI